jgi:hypothetical protein
LQFYLNFGGLIIPGGATIILMDGAPGFLPIKELSWSKRINPSELEQLSEQLLTMKVIGRPCKIHISNASLKTLTQIKFPDAGRSPSQRTW